MKRSAVSCLTKLCLTTLVLCVVGRGVQAASEATAVADQPEAGPARLAPGATISELRFGVPIEASGVAMVPLSELVNWLGGRVWDLDSEGKVLAAGGDDRARPFVTITVGSRNALLGGKPIVLPAAPCYRNLTTYVPVRTFVEAFGGTIRADKTIYGLVVSKSDKVGYLLLPNEPLPSKYDYGKVIAIARRQERLGDTARARKETARARCHYRTAYYAAERIRLQESLDNPLVEREQYLALADARLGRGAQWLDQAVGAQRSALQQPQGAPLDLSALSAYQQSAAWSLEEARRYQDSAQRCLLEAQRSPRGIKRLRVSLRRYQEAKVLRDRLQAKIAKQ